MKTPKYLYKVNKSLKKGAPWVVFSAKVLSETNCYYFIENVTMENPFWTCSRYEKTACTTEAQAIDEEINRCRSWVSRFKEKLAGAELDLESALLLKIQTDIKRVEE